jgi:photosystem II stability/assembly factor-like uncharacterized protein
MATLISCILTVYHSRDLHGQAFEQVYPNNEVHDYMALAHWNGDTVFAAGSNSGFIRSTDAGLTWKSVFHSNTGYNFVRMGMNSSGIYLIPAQTMSTESQFADRTTQFILKYDPWKDDTTRISVPCPVKDNEEDRSLFSTISVTEEGIFIIQSVRPDTVGLTSYKRTLTLLHRRNEDAGWSCLTLPDSISSIRPSIFFIDAMRGYLLLYPETERSVYVTADGGRNWERIQGVSTPNRYYGYTVDAVAQWVNDSAFVMATDKYALKKTTDMGKTWSEPSIVPTPHISSFSFLPNGTGIVAGEYHDMVLTTDFGNSWQIIHPQNNSKMWRFMQSVVLDSVTFIAAGYDGYIYRTTDAGVTWDTPWFTPVWYSPMHFTTDLDGIGYCISYFEDVDKQYCTSADGGRTWTGAFSQADVSNATPVPADDRQLWAIKTASDQVDTLIYSSTDGGQHWNAVCLSSSVGNLRFPTEIKGVLSCGRDSFMVFSDRGILRTTNRGSTWELHSQVLDVLPSPADLLNSYIALYCQSPGYQWLVAGNGLLRSSDFGANWRCMYSIPDSMIGHKKILSANAVDGMTVCLYIRQPDYQTSFELTKDAGETWEGYTNNLNFATWYELSLESLFPGGIGYSYYIKHLIYTVEKIVYKTTDYWHTATPIYSVHESDNNVRGGRFVYFRNKETGWLKSFNVIYRTTNGGIDWVQAQATTPHGVTLDAIYPNPAMAGAGTYITYAISSDKPQPVTIEVYDIMGRKVWDHRREAVLSGEHTVRWDTGHLRPGVYVVRLVSGNACGVRKVVVQ